MPHSSNQTELNFDTFESSHWPNNGKFPLNLESPGESRTVEAEVLKDINTSSEYLIITGFTSLSHLVATFGSNEFPKLERLRIVLGWEPNPYGRKTWPVVHLDREIKEYWLKRGLSIIYGGAIIRLIELIKEGNVEFRYRNKLHAKLYVGESHAILGSANFSKNGLQKQEEANIRVSGFTEDLTEASQYDSIKSIAEKFYELAAPYNEPIIKLLEELIQQVSWEEALARAIAEVIEGDWLKDYTQLHAELTKAKLWPTQWAGIAQAMTIIQNRSNVLIADPTGAGKTKFCSALILTLIHWLWENGKQDRTNSLIVCPPLVTANWRQEFRELSRVNHSQISMWLFSNAGKNKMDEATKDIQLANIIALDEAHNYLNPDSKRSKAVQYRKADHTLLVTATPMNKKAEDLLRLIELLDPDNLKDEDFEVYRELREQRRALKPDDYPRLREFISQFIVRRTKVELNAEIKKEPEKYLNKHGKPCKFPQQLCPTYPTQETEKDKEIVQEITHLAGQLKGVIYLRSIFQPEYDLPDEEAKKKYINQRLRAATALSKYMVRSALRSSVPALVEHVLGSDAAMDFFKFKTKKNKTGNQVDKIEEFKLKLPRKAKEFDKSLFPTWLVDRRQYQKACEEENDIYRKIARLAKQLSTERELGKVRHLIALQEKHKLIVAFDSTVITLDYLNSLFEQEKSNSKIYVVSGNTATVRNEVMEQFQLGSTAESCIALCSDQMSEGVNLQQASAVVLLDMPSVLRIMEQRIGRIDRMDSPHEAIEAYWPDDSEEYSLKGDQRLVQTNEIAETLYGSNINVPTQLKEKHVSQVDTTQDIIDEYRDFVKNDQEWDGIHNSFKPVLSLKEGAHALITEEVYEQFRNVSTTVKARVSFVSSNANWCFFALRGSKKVSPRWYFLDSEDTLHTEFQDICDQLRNQLSNKVEKLPWDQLALERFITKMRQQEVELLPHKKRRALKVAKTILQKKLNKEKDRTRKSLLRRTIGLFITEKRDLIVDYYEFAQQWIEILQPYLDEKRAGDKRKRKVYNLYSLERDYKRIDLSNEQLQQIIDQCPYTEQIDQKIAACIIGTASTEHE